MSKPFRGRRRTGSLRQSRPNKSLEQETRDRRLVESELLQTRLQLEIERLRETRKELDHARDRLEAIYQHIPIAYITLDESGLITEWNPTAAELLASPTGMLLNTPFTHQVARQDLSIVQGHLRRCRRAPDGEVVSELHLKHGEQRGIPVQMVSVVFKDSERKFFQTALIDLTERRKNERVASEAREFSDAIIRTIHEPLLVLDARLRFVRVNEAFGKLFGIPPGLAQGLSFESVFNLWWTGNQLRLKLEQALFGKVPVEDLEFEIQPRDQGRRILLFNARPLPQPNDSSPLLLVALRDITEQKEVEEQLAETNRRLQQLNDQLEKRVEERMKDLRESNEQLESFCYSIAHDLRAPLRSMAGFATALLDDFAPKLGDRGRHYADRVVASARQMDELIADLLEYGRLNTMQITPRPLACEEILTRVLASLRSEVEQKRARIECKGKLPAVLGHQVVLEAVFSNLIGNALKFVLPGTTPEVTIWPEERERQVCIWVADNGIGIEPEYRQKVFEIFQRLHPQNAYPGTGIGLALVHRALQRIGGEVGVESEPGKGSRFWFTIPKVPQTGGEAIRAKPATSTPAAM